MNTFEINILLLNKYGWLEYSYPNRQRNNSLEEAVTVYYFGAKEKDNFDVIYFFKSDNVIFLISKASQITKQRVCKTKQSQKKEYKFVIYKDRKAKEIDINSNIELLKLIIKHNACSEDYIRHFKLNKLLR